jgi:hypothetical protein
MPNFIVKGGGQRERDMYLKGLQFAAASAFNKN